MMRSSYDRNDVTILLKDITGQVTPLDTLEREKLNQGGVHYSEMLPVEYEPTEEYMKIYESVLENNAHKTAQAIVNLGNKIYNRIGRRIALVSLARAGTPIGILLRRYLMIKYNIDAAHYSMSIIRGKGLDMNALNYILDKEPSSNIQFVDGWIGKGAIQKELKESLSSIKNYNIDPILNVVADPAHIVPNSYCGSREDFIIPSSCLNATVSGLFSRTFRRSDIIGESDFDGAIYYENMKPVDKSIEFIETIYTHIKDLTKECSGELYGQTIVKEIMKEYNVKDINKIKPGIGETTRVLLRRVPEIVLISSSAKNDNDLSCIIQLCKEKHVPIKYCDLKCYKAVGIIKEMGDL